MIYKFCKYDSLIPTVVFSTMLVSLVFTGSAYTEEAAPLNLDKIVVTGSTSKTSKMKSSTSISTMNAEQIHNTASTNSAEVLRSIPGVRSESSGGEGNANITVRGLPISAGGSRYVQIQEDGLPILQFGDIAFATPDMFFRVDQSISHLEVLRGGSASTMATNAAGGIINFINKTGEEKGGKVSVTNGVTLNETRSDFSYGTPLSKNGLLRGFISGFYRKGQGVRDADTVMLNGGQIKGNLTQDFRNGYFRISFKHLEDQTPANMPLPSNTSNYGRISQVGINPLTGTLYAKNWITDISRTHHNELAFSNVKDGLKVQTDSVGAEFYYVAAGWTISEKFRIAMNGGRFIGIFPSSGIEPITGNFSTVVFNTKINNVGNAVNDFKIDKKFATEEFGKWTPTVGIYSSLQNLGLTWSFNQYQVSSRDNTVIPQNGSLSQWDNCCTRDIDAKYKTISPYAALAWEIGKLNIDGSIRKDNQSASGNYNLATDSSLTGNALPGQGQFLPFNRKIIHYQINRISYSVGANYSLTQNFSVFTRISTGSGFNADRIMYGTVNLNEGVIPINKVVQYETGIKFRQGKLNSFLTFFRAKTDESNYDATTQKATSNRYDASGLELEMGYSIKQFRLGWGLTYTEAEIVNAGIGKNRTPNRQAKYLYQLTPSYRILDKLIFASSIIGTTSSWDSDHSVLLPAYTTVNSVIRYAHNEQWQFSLTANNLFNTVGYTEAQKTVARSIDGRSVRVAAVFSF